MGTVQKIIIAGAVALSAHTLCCHTPANALPFNTDMYHGQIHTGDVMRPKAKDSVPVGALSRYIGEKREDALKLENPQKGDSVSTANGQRLFAVNCSPCHGTMTDGKLVPGVVSKWLPGPNLADTLYKDKPDGHFFQYIHYGGVALMPAYGYKFSISEHWDIVNYIRSIQPH